MASISEQIKELTKPLCANDGFVSLIQEIELEFGDNLRLLAQMIEKAKPANDVELQAGQIILAAHAVGSPLPCPTWLYDKPRNPKIMAYEIRPFTVCKIHTEVRYNDLLRFWVKRIKPAAYQYIEELKEGLV